MALHQSIAAQFKQKSINGLAEAIVRTVAYVDVFDYPLRPAEVHRYLIGVATPRAPVEAVLGDGHLVPEHLERRDEYVMLVGRRQIVETRRQREEVAKRLWPIALHYGGLIASLPYVRMVAITGSLAVNNPEAEADIDYMIVTANDRLWLSRAFVVLIVHLAARQEIRLCPNYLLSERALSFSEQNLYTAHELVQMVPLSGWDIYRLIRRLNRWTDRWLPNAAAAPRPRDNLPPEMEPAIPRLQKLLEWGLGGRFGQRLEAWEMERKVFKLGQQAARIETDSDTQEAQFSADWCKGHFAGHGRQVIEAYTDRIKSLGVQS